ncbi:hypothetical protein CDCA_CDCA08G2353 [Cyanidium caldarium]|uniref:Uncharacterized protein n=1 Tax=Cyanidium caldarium TaxID=2771 RepID=A0AAV9IWZ6_CYACA|nr:hypothetical protein CDCA_CDCA08G2353 [Cyanidium caldarium]
MGKYIKYALMTAAVGAAAAGGYFTYAYVRRRWDEEFPASSGTPRAATAAAATPTEEKTTRTETPATANNAVAGKQAEMGAAVAPAEGIATGGKGAATPSETSAAPLEPATEPGTDATTAVDAGVDEAELASQLDASLRNIQDTGNADTPRERKLLKRLQSIPSYENLSAPCRFVIAQWCHTVFCTRTAAQYNPASGAISLEQALEVRRELKKTYLESAWSLLEMGGFEEMAAESAHVTDAETRQVIQESVSRSAALKLDVACRMHDAELMSRAYDDALRQADKSGKPLDANDKLVLLASAALTGRCDEVVRLGGGVGRAELDVLHTAALKDPTMVDYGALYLLSLKIVEEQHRLEKEYRQRQEAAAEEVHPEDVPRGFTPGLAWEAYTVRNTRFRLRPKAETSSDKAATSAPSSPSSSSQPVPLRPGVTTDKWTEQKPHAGVNLIRTGALVHYINPGAVPIPISGFGTENEVRLFGYVDVQDQENKEQMRHMDMFKLVRDADHPTMWRGTETTTLFCVSGRRKGHTLATSVLEVEFEMETDRSAIWQVL